MGNQSPKEKQIVFVDDQTGEIYQGLRVHLIDETIPDEEVTLYVHSKGKEFGVDNIGWYRKPIDKPKVLELDDEFGTYRRFEDKRKWSRVYQVSMPEFTSDRFCRYWLHVERAIEMNSGVIGYRDDNGSFLRCKKSVDWERLLPGSKRSIEEFRRQCESNRYFAPIQLSDILRVWVANPRFIWNGNLIPESVWELFSDCLDND